MEEGPDDHKLSSKEMIVNNKNLLNIATSKDKVTSSEIASIRGRVYMNQHARRFKSAMR